MRGPLSAHVADDLVALIGVELMRRRSARIISRRFGPSEDMACKVLDAMDTPRPYLPGVLRVDELGADTDAGKTGACAVDGMRGVLIDVLRDRRPETLDAWFSQLGEEELRSAGCLCCDMRWGFVNAAERWLPCAEVCIDRFHVVRCTTKAFGKVRARPRREAGSDVKRGLRKARKLFLTREPHLEDLDAKRVESGKEPLAHHVEYLLGMSEELAEAYARPQAFYCFVDEQADAQNRRRAFGNWISVSQSCGVPEVESAAKTFKGVGDCPNGDKGRRWRPHDGAKSRSGPVCLSLPQQPRGDAHVGPRLLYVPDDHGARAHHAPAADADVVAHDAADAEPGPVAHRYRARDVGAHRDVGEPADAAVVVDRGPRVDDGALADADVGVDDGPRHDNGAPPDLDASADGGGGVHQRDGAPAEPPLDALASASVPDGDEEVSLGEAPPVRRPADDGQARALGRALRVIQERDVPVPDPHGDVGHNLPVAAGPYDDQPSHFTSPAGA